MAEMEPKTSVVSNTYISELKSKYSEKPWSETLQLVRRCMDKSRTDGKPCEPIIRCLQTLRNEQNVTSVNAMVTRLEMIANQRGLGSHLSPTETVCYLTADLFYLEVLLLPGGGVEDVKVAQHGEAPESNVSLLQLLRMKKFEEFSQMLNDLASLYNIPGNNDTKVKVYTALQHLEKDLVKISNLPRCLIERDVHVDIVLNGRLGSIMPSRGGSPMSIQYYISPSDILMKEVIHPGEGTLGQVAEVAVGASTTTHRLQMDSVIPTPPQVDSLGLPVFRSEVCTESLPASFLLRLQPPLPTLGSLSRKMSQITELPLEGSLQGVPLFHLLDSDCLEKKNNESSHGAKDACFLMSLPDDEIHSYVFCGAAWECESWRGALIHTVSFTHPAHVPILLELLRHQSAINVLLASCISSHKHQLGHVHGLSCEVLPESDCSFSVTFSVLDRDTLAVLLVSVVDSRQVCCRLLLPGGMDHSLDDYISKVLTRCMSIPITIRAIRKRVARMRCLPTRLSEHNSAVNSESLPPSPHLHTCSSPHCSRVKSDSHVLRLAPSSPETMEQHCLNSSPTHRVVFGAAGPVSDGANTDAVANPSPTVPVGVCSHQMASSFSPELI
ncbi:mediator of RNA polymerase II transcription subunit 1-like [Brachyhypopomus gauderio]|uniref:mediator of RNA polymerase II transcription subunit 1-like n=1 Tax=Brachyhypopomus gauderio TaxID=698409 RepID=UPI00404285FD